MGISIRNLTHVYPTENENVVALNGLDLDVPDGQVCVVRGPNGSGKSTLIEIIASNLTPTAGQIATAPSNGARPRVRVLRQFDHSLLQFSVGQYIDTITSINKVHFDLVNYQAVLNRRIADVPPGQRQILAIELAMTSNPDILLADEPTAALNREQSLDVYEFLSRSCRTSGITLLLVTHDRRAEAFADRVVRIRNGRISEEWIPGAPEQQVIDSHGWLRLPESVVARAPRSMGSALFDDHVSLFGLSEHTPEEIQQKSVRQSTDIFLCLEDVTLMYPPQSLVFKNFNVQFHHNALNVILGPSGSGKSSLLHLASGLIPPTSGQVVYFSVGTKSADDDQVREHTQQDRALFGGDLDLGQAQSLNDFQVHHELISLLHLDQLAHRPLQTLSGGQRQRANFAIALNHPAGVLFLDEPTSSLDVENRDLLMAIIQKEIRRGRTIVMATHDEELADQADYLIDLS